MDTLDRFTIIIFFIITWIAIGFLFYLQSENTKTWKAQAKFDQAIVKALKPDKANSTEFPIIISK